jgi:titin
VQGNFIGTDASGSTDLGNDEFGVLVGGGSSDNTIGGTSTGERNVISGNKSGGVLIITDAVDNVVEGNFVGTDVSGTLDLGNGNFGVLSAPNNTIGGTTGTTPGGPCTGSCNLISGNDFRGVSIGGPGVVQGNFIGTDVSGTLDLGNSVFGLSVGGSGSVIGGTTPAARNVISGNGEIGIDIGGSGHLVQGNFIGTNAAGTGAIGNGAGGVFDAGVSLPNGASSNTIGGTAPGARNLISGNNRSGVSMTGGTGNMVQGNFIGTDITGSLSLGNVLDGVIIWLNASGNTVGGTATGARNVISGNSRDGVEIFNAGATGNLIQGNSIGTQADGSSPLGNGSSGVVISDAPGNTVGGTSAAASNTIAFNGVFFGAGVFVGSGTGNGILGNSIFSNFSQGIDLSGDGVTANDAGDGDTGPNNLQNFPVLTSAVSKSGAVKIGGSLSSTRKTNFTVEFFANAACDSSGHGEGERFLGRQVLKTDVSGNTKISASFKAAVAPGEVVTATATDPSNNTSEFSQCRVVTAK